MRTPLVRQPALLAALLVAAARPLAAQVSASVAEAPVADPAVTVARTDPGEPGRVEFRMAGAPSANWNLLVRAAQDSVFGMAGFSFNEGRMQSQSLARGLSFQIGLQLWGSDSTIVAVSGYRYGGPGARPGYYPMQPEYWHPIGSDPAGIAILRAEGSYLRHEVDAERERMAAQEREMLQRAAGRAVTVMPGVPGFAEPNPDSIVRRLSSGVLGYCRAGHFRRDHNLDSLLIVDIVNAPEWCPLSPYDTGRISGNTYVLRDPRTVAVGDTVGVCTHASFSGGRARFAAVALYTDEKHCRLDPQWEQKREPNMTLLRRVE